MPEQNFLYSVLPSLVGFSFYWLAVSLIHAELHKKTDTKHIFTDFIASCGKNSYGMYLVHAFISWYAIKDLTWFLTLKGYDYPDLTLYLILYIPSVLAIYGLGLCMKRILDSIDRKLRPSG